MDAAAKMYKLYDEDGNCTLDGNLTVGIVDEDNSWINWTSGIYTIYRTFVDAVSML